MSVLLSAVVRIFCGNTVVYLAGNSAVARAPLTCLVAGAGFHDRLGHLSLDQVCLHLWQSRCHFRWRC